MPEKSRSQTSIRGHMISPVAAPPPQQPLFDKERLLMTGRDDSRDDINKRKKNEKKRWRLRYREAERARTREKSETETEPERNKEKQTVRR
jgi:hypothetical protein